MLLVNRENLARLRRMIQWIWNKTRKLFDLPYLPVLLAPVILFSPVWLVGNALFWGTPYLQFFPWWSWSWQTILNGHLPLWNPLVGMGAPLAANYQSALFYPVTWLSFLLYVIGGKSLMAWGQTWVVIFHLIWAGLGMVVLTRSLGLNKTAQAVGAIAFEMCGYLVARAGFFSINATAAWLPWVLWAGMVLMNSPKQDRSRFLPILSACLGMQLLAGHAQTAYYTWLLLAGWLAFWGLRSAGWQGLGSAVIKLITATSLAFGVAAVQLIPTAEYLLQSQRASTVEYEYAVNYSFFPLRFFTLLAPNLFGSPAYGNYMLTADNYWEDAVYIGLLPLFMAVGISISLFQRKKQKPPGESNNSLGKPLICFLTILTIVSFVLALGKNTPIFPFLYQYIPTFSMFQAPARLTIWAEFSLPLLAAIGIDHWHKPAGRGKYWSNLGRMGAVAVSVGALLCLVFLPGVSTALVVATAIAGVLSLAIGLLSRHAPSADNPVPGHVWSWLVVSMVCFDLLLANWGSNPGVTLELYNRETTQSADMSNILAGHRLYIDPDSENILKYQRYFHFNSFIPQENWVNMIEVFLPNSNMMSDIASANNFDPLTPSRYSRWMTYLAQTDDSVQEAMLSIMDVKLIESIELDDPDGVATRVSPIPQRIYWTSCAKVVSNKEQAWDETILLMQKISAGAKLGSEEVVLEGVETLTTQCTGNKYEKSSLFSETPGQVTVKLASERDGWLVLSDTWYPGWKVTVDGRASQLLRANYLFLGVKVPEGEHTIVFYYQPASYPVGAGISVLSLAGIIFLYKKSRLTH
jgi:hypothetical protein